MINEIHLSARISGLSVRCDLNIRDYQAGVIVRRYKMRLGGKLKHKRIWRQAQKMTCPKSALARLINN
jgi:hypothetical protein